MTRTRVTSRVASIDAGGHQARRSRALLKALREIFLTAVAVAGLLCVIALILGAFFKVSFIVFRTGSMEPEYPVGAFSLVIEVPAKELTPGDVVSVTRENSKVLVTHRVVEVRADYGGAVLTLKGDANSSQDPLPYKVDTARKVLFTVPGLGAWVMAMQGPWFIGAASLVVAALVAWAFWPKNRMPNAKAAAAEGTKDSRTSTSDFGA